MQLGTPGPFHRSQRVLQPTFKILTVSLVIYDYLFGEILPHTRAEVVTFIFVARICWDVQLVHLCQGNPTKVVEHGPCINSLCCCWDPEGIVILGEEVWVVEHHRKDCWLQEEKQLCIVIVRPNALGKV